MNLNHVYAINQLCRYTYIRVLINRQGFNIIFVHSVCYVKCLVFSPYIDIFYILTDTCNVIHVIYDVLRSLDDFVFGQHRVHDINGSRAHVVRHLIDSIIILVKQCGCNKTKKRI